MQIVIEIDEERYINVKNQVKNGIDNPLKVIIANGTPLPKGHGRLIDAAVLRQKMGNLAGFDLLGRCIDEEPTIIEADGGDTDGGSL